MNGFVLLILTIAAAILVLSRGSTDGHPFLVSAMAFAAAFCYWLFEPSDD